MSGTAPPNPNLHDVLSEVGGFGAYPAGGDGNEEQLGLLPGEDYPLDLVDISLSEQLLLFNMWTSCRFGPELLPPASQLSLIRGTAGQNIYFDKVHYAAPSLHVLRYTASVHLPPHMRPPCVCSVYNTRFGCINHRELQPLGICPFYLRAEGLC